MKINHLLFPLLVGFNLLSFSQLSLAKKTVVYAEEKWTCGCEDGKSNTANLKGAGGSPNSAQTALERALDSFKVKCSDKPGCEAFPEK